MFSLSDYDYPLKPSLIAQEPSSPPESAKMLVCDSSSGQLVLDDKHFFNLPDILSSNDVLFFNNSKVVKARILLDGVEIENTGKRSILNRGECFFLFKESETFFSALLRPGKKFSVGTKIIFDEKTFLEVIEDHGRIKKISSSQPIEKMLEKYGTMPLPPYISYDDSKAKDYQPVFAENPGSVASPTASLHFSQTVLDELTKKNIDQEFVTLHVGLGTFQSVDTENIRDYKIHSERVEIGGEIFEKIFSLKKSGKKIIAVGTTTTRILESLPFLWSKITSKITVTEETKKFRDNMVDENNDEIITNILCIGKKIIFDTKIFLYPTKKFSIVDSLITNFHLPKSSLLMLVAGFVGFDNMKKIYDHAIHHEYKFYSFGDGMILLT